MQRCANIDSFLKVSIRSHNFAVAVLYSARLSELGVASVTDLLHHFSQSKPEWHKQQKNFFFSKILA